MSTLAQPTPLVDRPSYWNFVSENLSKSSSVLFDRTYAKSVLIDKDDFSRLHDTVFSIIRHSLVLNQKADPSQLDSAPKILAMVDQTVSLQLTKNLALYVELEAAVTECLLKLGVLKGISGIEFPMNVRVAHGNPPPGYMQREDATDYLHSDIWADEPKDIVNGLIYVDGDIDATYMELYDCPESHVKSIESYTGAYKGGSKLAAGCPQIDYSPQKSQLLLFDGVCPHQTVRKGGKTRVSVDFRIRRADPYQCIDSRWERERVPWGKYWHLPQVKRTSFESRCEDELNHLLKSRNEAAYNARKRWIVRLQASSSI
ncbi:MAG: hypothetical protein AB1540_03080 [Bdellovibrionota bacterium]